MTRPLTRFTRALKKRRCPKCGGAVNSQRVRCKRCSSKVPRPVKTCNS
ncbi:MAG: hypothetical protein Q4C47_07970 [Planctomycetia bacterium]|nr:hypothetical protein [Planctomycetia bacterium]